MNQVDDDPFGAAVTEPAKPKRAPRRPVVADAPQPSPYTGPIEFVILGEPCSKANSRELATVGPKDKRKMIFRKSDAALEYEANALKQIPPKLRLQIPDRLSVTLRIFYANPTCDLDESIVLDVMQNRHKLVEIPGQEKKHRVLIQAGVYVNDNQVKEKHVYHHIDKLNPRTEVRIVSIEEQGALL